MSTEGAAAADPLLGVQVKSRKSQNHVGWAVLSLALVALLGYASLFSTTPDAPASKTGERSFVIDNNKFVKNGAAMQLISGSVHYQRIHPAYWRDRLLRVRSMGLNAIQVYVPWNLHQPAPPPANTTWSGFADLEGFLKLAHSLDLLVLLRPGPYICAEWDFGGFPWWLANTKVRGGRTMRLRSSDPDYLAHVDAWWGQLLPRVAPLLWQNGGPVVMVQVENEYGFCGSDKAYLRHLVATARQHLGPDVILYTTDPPAIAPKGSIYGGEVYTVVDFGAGWFQLHVAFLAQRAMNARGMSPPFCSEYYTGWLTHWGEAMANTSASAMVSTLKGILRYAGSTGSVNLYMAHGGTNFGYWAGANVGDQYWPHITSYDYDCPVSEAGCTGQPGVGGPNKFEMIRAAVAEHTGQEPPPREAPPRIAALGTVDLTQSARLLDSLHALAGAGTATTAPDIMEQYDQMGGFIVYRANLDNGTLPAAAAAANTLDLGKAPHDYAHVLLNGKLVGRLDRDHSAKLRFGSPAAGGSAGSATLDIVVHALGRYNFGCAWDTKGLQSPVVTMNGSPLRNWTVFSLGLEDLSGIEFRDVAAAPPAAAMGGGAQSPAAVALHAGPVFFRGTFLARSAANGGGTHPPDTYLSTPGFVKGLAFVNGFNLGWYWPAQGPQQTLYIPGPLLRDGANELVLLEAEAAPPQPALELVAKPDFRKWAPLPKRRRPPWLGRRAGDVAAAAAIAA